MREYNKQRAVDANGNHTYSQRGIRAGGQTYIYGANPNNKDYDEKKNASYDNDDHRLAYWGLDELTTLLDHYGVQKTNKNGQVFPPLVNRDECLGEFLPFKREVFALRVREVVDGVAHKRRPVELMEEMFGDNNYGNRRIY